MRGDLSETTLPAICRSLAADGATGRLVLDSADGPGLISLTGGSISDARAPRPRARLAERLTGGGHLDELTLARVLHGLRAGDRATGPSPGQVSEVVLARALLEQGLVDPMPVEEVMIGQVVDALVELSARHSGSFSFLPGDPGAARRTGGAVLVDIEVALTLLRRRAEALGELPPTALRPDTVPQLLLEDTVPGDQLGADAVTVLAAIDDERNVHELAEFLGYGSYDLAIIVADLYERGIVTLTHPQDDIGAALDLALRSSEVEPSSAEQTTPSPDSGAPRRDHDAPAPMTRQERARDDETVHRATVADWVFEDPEVAWPAAGPAVGESTPAETVPADPTPAGRTGEQVDHEDTDVSEFLRELSALALGDTAPPKGRGSTSPGNGSAGRQDRGGDTGAGASPAGRPHEASEEAALGGSPSTPATRTPATRKPTDEAAREKDGGRKRRRGLFGRG